MDQRIKTRLLNKEWEFKCSHADKDKFHEAALHLDHHMQALKKKSRELSYDQITLLAAITLSHELIKQKNDTTKLKNIKNKIIKLRATLAEKLAAVNKA